MFVLKFLGGKRRSMKSVTIFERTKGRISNSLVENPMHRNPDFSLKAFRNSGPGFFGLETPTFSS